MYSYNILYIYFYIYSKQKLINCYLLHVSFFEKNNLKVIKPLIKNLNNDYKKYLKYSYCEKTLNI